MNGIDATTTLAEVVDTFPALARDLERLGLDYCCGGGRTIEQACASAGLDLEATLMALTARELDATPAEWTSMAADELVDHLETVHHRYLWDELARIGGLVDRIVAVHGERHPELTEVAGCFAALRAELEQHLLKEERVLFPMVRELAASTSVPAFHCGTLRNPISVMLHEHDVAGDLLARLRRLTDGYSPPADGCATYAACFHAMEVLEADTHLHIHKENNVLFPLVVRLEAERAVIPTA